MALIDPGKKAPAFSLKKSLYGRQLMGNARTTYLIGADGKVVQRWDNVKVQNHAEAVLAAVNAMP